MNRIKYAEQLYALISMCLGCAFIVFGLLSFIGILQPTSTRHFTGSVHKEMVFYSRVS